MSETTQFLKETVYPSLDAADAGLLDALNPRRTGKHYLITCPTCQKREGYYYAGSAYLNCNRRVECGIPVSIWDYVQGAKSLSNGETFITLCSAAGVEPPNKDQQADPKAAAAVSKERHFATGARDVFRQLLYSDPEAMAYLTDVRKLTRADIDKLPLGYYPDKAKVAAALQKAGLPLDVATAWEVLPVEGDKESPYARRIVSYWPLQDGGWRLVGRAIDADRKPKYRYASSEFGFNRTVPYNFKTGRKGLLVGVEGFFDALAYELMGVPCCALGGAEVIRAQADYFDSRGVRTFLHVVDGDRAGMNGGAKTVENCEGRGIPVLIGVSPDEQDPDSLRQAGNHQVALDIVEASVSGGEFLARALLSLTDKTGPTAAADRTELLRKRAALTPDSALAFDLYFSRLGLRVEDPQVSCLRTVLAMVTEGGTDWDTAVKKARDRYGLQLTVKAVDQV